MKVLPILLILIAIGGIGFAVWNHMNKPPRPESVDALVGKPAPAIALRSLDGAKFNLADQAGKVILIDAWATWCPPCRESLPHLQKLASDRRLASQGLVVWAINQAEAPDTVKNFLTENRYSFTVLLDNDDLMGNSYGISGIPTTLIIGRDGSVKFATEGFGSGSAEEIDEALASVLNSK